MYQVPMKMVNVKLRNEEPAISKLGAKMECSIWLFLLFYKSSQKRVFFSPLEEKEDIPSKFEALEEIVEIEEAGAWLEKQLGNGDQTDAADT